MKTNKAQVSLSAGLILALSCIYGLISVDMVKAQTNRSNNPSPNISIDDGARYLRGLKIEDSFEWDFTTGENREVSNNYYLSISDPDIRIVEQNIPEWRNTGEDANYSVLVDVFEFTEDGN